MASTIEKGRDGSIVYKAADTLSIPSLDLLSLLFDSQLSGAEEDSVLHADAADPSKAVTKAQLRVLVKRTAHTLRTRFGIGANGPNKDVVLAIAGGHFLLANVFLAAIAADGIFSASSPSSTPAELAGQFAQVDAKLLLCTEDTRDTAIAAAKLAKIPPQRVLFLGEGRDFELLEAESGRAVPLSPQQLSWRRIEDRQTLEDSIICILFSSGTTGRPKGVRLSHYNTVAEATLTTDPLRTWYRANKPGFEYRTLAHLPAAHIAGIQGYLVNPAYYGGVVYWMPRFDFARFLEHNRRLRITFLFTVPPIYLLISKSPAVTDQLDAIDSAVSGAAPMGKELQRAATAKLGRGKALLSQVWGLSETTGAITVLPRHMRDDSGSVSPLLANSVARIVDDDGRDVQPGADGEVWVKSPVVTKGYHRDEEANREAFRDGWFCTGDIGHFKNGMLYIVDRKKELIKYKGAQVAPAELEALLITHPKILDAAVIGVSRDATEVPRAYVVADEKQISAQEIIDWVAGQVSNPKRLRGGVAFVQAIPKSPSGKILRKVLRDAAKKKMSARL